MKKILFVIPGLGIGGTNSALDALFSHIRNEYEVSVFAISYHTQKRNYSFNEVLLPLNRTLSFLFTDFRAQKGLLKLIAFGYKTTQSILRFIGIDLMSVVGRRIVKKIEARNNYDYIIAYQEGFATKFVTFFQNANKIAWIHCDYNKWLPNGSELDIYNCYNKIVCVSNSTASIFTNRYPTLKDRMLAIHNLIDTERVLELSKHPIDDERFVCNHFTILSVGRFCDVKRFRAIPRIANSLKDMGVDFNWYIIGPDSSSAEMKAFNDNLDEFKVGDCVKWLGGKYNPYCYYKKSNLYVCTSESEACPMVFNEAKIFGMPIVTTDFPSAYEFVDEKTGKIVKLDKMADAIWEIINNKDNKYSGISINEEEKTTIQQIHLLFV